MQNSRHNHSQKTGWLHKRGGRIQTWHKRWFVLTGDLLFYYKTPQVQDTRPTGTIPLAGNNVVRHQDDSRQMHSCKFEIVAGSGRNYITSTHDSFMISAETSDDADEWVASIKRVLHEPYGGGMFGRSLEETMTVEARLGGEYIPILVHRCAKFILEHGLKEIGIFRLPGQSSRVQALKDTYDHGSQVDIPSSEDVHTVASLLKLYLRELPEPVIPFTLFDRALAVAKLIDHKSEKGMQEKIEFLMKLPVVNYNVLKYLCRFLYEVAEHSNHNRMNCTNLATVFGPNIMRPEFPNPLNLIESSNASVNCVCALISSQEELFPLTVDEKPPKRLSIVNLAEYLAFNKSNTKTAGSLFVKSMSPKPENRTRLGSVPTRFISPPAELDKKMSKKKFTGLDSPRRTKKFNALSVFDSTVIDVDTRSGRVSPIIMSPFLHVDDEEGFEKEQTKTDLLQDDVILSPELTKTSRSDEYSHMRTETMGTVSPDLLVNSIAKEMESLDRQLQVMKSAYCKKRRETRLWKSRCNQERRARLAAEERIASLQSLLDETFQQFALDDSEDEDFDDDSLSGDSLLESSLGSGMPLDELDQTPSPLTPTSVNALPNHVRHIRSNSTQIL